MRTAHSFFYSYLHTFDWMNCEIHPRFQSIHVAWHMLEWKITALCPNTLFTRQLLIFKWDYSDIMPWNLQLILLICSRHCVKEHQPLEQPWRRLGSNSNINIECVLTHAVSSVPVGGSHINVSGFEQVRCEAFKIHQVPKFKKKEIPLHNRCSFTSC